MAEKRRMTIVFDFEFPQTKALLGNYISEMTTDSSLAKAYKKMTGREMIGPDIGNEEGFDFMVNGNILFNKFYELYRNG